MAKFYCDKNNIYLIIFNWLDFEYTEVFKRWFPDI